MVVIVREEKPKNSNIIFIEGDRMSNGDFRLSISKITKCENIEDKINLIKLSIQSIYDFIDLLNSNCLFGEEFTDLFNTLSDMELSILGRMVFNEELREGSLKLVKEIINKRYTDIEWEMQYIAVLQEFSEDRIKSIERYINGIY